MLALALTPLSRRRPPALTKALNLSLSLTLTLSLSLSLSLTLSLSLSLSLSLTLTLTLILSLSLSLSLSPSPSLLSLLGLPSLLSLDATSASGSLTNWTFALTLSLDPHHPACPHLHPRRLRAKRPSSSPATAPWARITTRARAMPRCAPARSGLPSAPERSISPRHGGRGGAAARL